MSRDSFFGEQVVWSGRPKVVVTPTVYRVASAVCAVASAITTASAIVVASALGASPSSLLAFAAWMATLAIALGYLPRWWRAELEFQITEKHVIVRRGRLRRTVERRAISYARIHWYPGQPDVGDLELVRAVPTGALRRRLSIVLAGVIGPDRVWATVRGVVPACSAGNRQRLLSQRLDEDERVLWSGQPAHVWTAWLPSDRRTLGALGLSVAMSAAAVAASTHAIAALRRLVEGGYEVDSVWFVALVASVTLTVAMLGSAALAIGYFAVVQPARLAAQTRYLVTDRRVLIQRGTEELHLDRAHVVDVIDAPRRGGLHDVFLVLDGPRAAALAPSGAFGETSGPSLQPVLHRVEDPEAVARILLAR
jgi:hypothetical protein